jgi:RNA polymerase sigma factor (sigma-70 family)
VSGIRCDPTDPAEVTSARVEDSDGAVSFDAFCSRELDWARRLAFVLTGSRDAADDIAQESFARICRHYDRLDNPRAYLRVVIVNLGRRRKRTLERDRPLGEAPDIAARAVSPEAVEVLDLIDRLPSRQRAVLVLRYFEGLSELEIASVLSCRPGTVKSLAARALSRLRKELDS